MINALISKVFGTRSDREIKLLYPLVDEINVLSDNLKEKSDDDLRQRTMELMDEVAISRSEAEEKARNEITDKDEAKKSVLLAEQKKLDSILPEAFAMDRDRVRGARVARVRGYDAGLRDPGDVRSERTEDVAETGQVRRGVAVQARARRLRRLLRGEAQSHPLAVFPGRPGR